ncbi:GNAT family N-acetyltransferase [Amycolatopsis alkalitolerans]|uniref:GNAT family N-acetyltransferase n=1 Tax=Amycolatopsis alkalitolerans TaxID=2547244 RepID=A0A5C4LZQ0_9PSEU|nr:GNAT family N-acetyltransferase [Amycolatopsis alkalitolerans]TNC24333.1 GNAT family N-acetyltransferase [Amycolatopsis alkalitolerans]
MLVIRRATPADVSGCVAIVRDSPDFFTSDVPGKVGADLEIHPAWVATTDDDLAGFAIVDRRAARGAEVLWMAVTASRRGGGVGTLLLEHVFRDLAESGVQVVEVKTQDASAGYEPYVATRAFWERRGFVHLDTIDPLPGWPPGNPAAIYVAALAATHR